jgi:hypothetical protein
MRTIPKVGGEVFVMGTDGNFYLGTITHVWTFEDGTIVPSEAISLKILVGETEHLVEIVPHQDFAADDVKTYWKWVGE